MSSALPVGSMLAMLAQVEAGPLAGMLADPAAWRSVLVDYHPPIVERLWADAEAGGKPCRVFLHRIHPAAEEDCLFHPHPWPSAVRILSGSYEMSVGYGKGMKAPPVASKLVLPAGAAYEMGDPDAWHSVRPVGGLSYSLMVTGKPWAREAHKPGKALAPLSEAAAAELLGFFKRAYPI